MICEIVGLVIFLAGGCVVGVFLAHFDFGRLGKLLVDWCLDGKEAVLFQRNFVDVLVLEIAWNDLRCHETLAESCNHALC